MTSTSQKAVLASITSGFVAQYFLPSSRLFVPVLNQSVSVFWISAVTSGLVSYFSDVIHDVIIPEMSFIPKSKNPLSPVMLSTFSGLGLVLAFFITNPAAVSSNSFLTIFGTGAIADFSGLMVSDYLDGRSNQQM